MNLSSLKRKIQNNALLKKPYYMLKKYKDEKIIENKFKFHGQVKKRSKDSEKLCIILAGYKEFLYDEVFQRIEKYTPRDIDVCVVTSGLYSEFIDTMCEKNDWSYISTEENNICLIQNVAIKEHPKAKYIYKLDEDMFITEGYFEKMMEALEQTKKGPYNAGFIAPLIPVNGFGHVRILEKLGLIEKYTELFERPIYASGPERMIENNPETAMFFWGKGGYVPGIDQLNETFSKEETKISPCPIRFSIGAILYERSLLEELGYFTVERDISGMAQDEIELCTYCCIKSRPIMITENVVVGHFSFGPQTNGMKEYHLGNKEKFRINGSI